MEGSGLAHTLFLLRCSARRLALERRERAELEQKLSRLSLSHHHTVAHVNLEVCLFGVQSIPCRGL
jgi:hypothetical protein